MNWKQIRKRDRDIAFRHFTRGQISKELLGAVMAGQAFPALGLRIYYRYWPIKNRAGVTISYRRFHEPIMPIRGTENAYD